MLNSPRGVGLREQRCLVPFDKAAAYQSDPEHLGQTSQGEIPVHILHVLAASAHVTYIAVIFHARPSPSPTSLGSSLQHPRHRLLVILARLCPRRTHAWDSLSQIVVAEQ